MALSGSCTDNVSSASPSKGNTARSSAKRAKSLPVRGNSSSENEDPNNNSKPEKASSTDSLARAFSHTTSQKALMQRMAR
eukprot:CAMPEP_0115484502 /NCGR_PEP_ID=MMETSP0271-20121206/59413_1 /TAXON_ID=71861 /ORGANISM="Scrippsiella trochoidea, Strain CCMP3099" /LENGTH=79 /DNA_ID=CAMNT_0002912403 /DNA_START=568 /DNA_END=807 /DNA_ORIENTATION=+